MQQSKPNHLFSIKSHNYKCSEDLNVFLRCVRCKNNILRLSSNLSFILMSFTNYYLYFFSVEKPNEEQIIINTTSKILCSDEPFKNVYTLSVQCIHCKTRIGTFLYGADSQSNQELSNLILIEIDSLKEDQQNPDMIEYLIDLGKEALDLVNFQIKHENIKLHDLLLSAKKQQASSAKSDSTRTISMEKRKENFDGIESKSSTDEDSENEYLYGSLQQQRIQIEKQFLNAKGNTGMDLNSIFNNLFKQNLKEKQLLIRNNGLYGDSIEETSEQSEDEFNQYHFGELIPLGKKDFSLKEGEYYYSSGQWYLYQNGSMSLTSRLQPFAVELVDQNYNQVKYELNEQNKAIRQYVKSKMQGSHRFINQKQHFTKSNPYQHTERRLNQLIEQYNKLVDEMNQSLEQQWDSSEEAEIIDDDGELEEFWMNSQGISGREDREKEDSFITTLCFYEERNRQLRERTKVAIAVDEEQSQKIKMLTDLK